MSAGSVALGARRRGVLVGLSALVLATLGGSFALLDPTAGAANLSCPQGTSEYKVDTNPLNGLSTGQSASFIVNGQTFTFTKVLGPDPFEDDTFNFSSTIAVSVAYVKGGADTNVYDYAPPATSGTTLHPPLNGGGQPPTISHVSFCVGDSTTTTSTSTSPSTSTSTSTSTTTTSTTVPDSTTSTTSTSTTTTSTTVPDTTTSTSTTTTSTTVPDTTTSTTVGDTTTSTSTTTTTIPNDATTVVSSTTTTEPTAVGPQGGTAPTTTTTPPSPITVPGTLPHTGSNSGFPVMFGFSCLAAGVLLIARRRRAWNAS